MMKPDGELVRGRPRFLGRVLMSFKRALDVLGWDDVGQRAVRVVGDGVERLRKLNEDGGCSVAALADVAMLRRREVYRWQRQRAARAY